MEVYFGVLAGLLFAWMTSLSLRPQGLSIHGGLMLNRKQSTDMVHIGSIRGVPLRPGDTQGDIRAPTQQHLDCGPFFVDVRDSHNVADNLYDHDLVRAFVFCDQV